MPESKPAELRRMDRTDFSWIASSKILRWKSWFYQGLVPKLSERGPLEAGAELERISHWINKYWPMRLREIRKAVRRNRVACDAPWDEHDVTHGLATQMLRYLARDCVLDCIPPHDWSEVFTVSGFDHLEDATGQGQGAILLGSHLGGHLAGVHWMIDHGVPLRMLVQRPRNVSRRLNSWFDEDHPTCTQREIFLKRDMSPSEAARRMTDARRLIRSGQCVYINCDIPWSGQNTDTYRFLGKPVRLQSIWIDLAGILGCPVISVMCRQKLGGRFELKFGEPMVINPREPREIAFNEAIRNLEKSILSYPHDAIAHLTWPHFRPHRGPSVTSEPVD
ncbi:MAG: hypothetical protein DWH73_02595 [Planctomycetota bacterium]|nr:MAG: hypothetical protein DWH73_02595 [Planctomycetota bacterium]